MFLYYFLLLLPLCTFSSSKFSEVEYFWFCKCSNHQVILFFVVVLFNITKLFIKKKKTTKKIKSSHTLCWLLFFFSFVRLPRRRRIQQKYLHCCWCFSYIWTYIFVYFICCCIVYHSCFYLKHTRIKLK